ncbi:MAG: ATP-binding protein [Desulfitobacterium hafniense]|nr:ATP-binding protein [Desulfitobacterium hafniense]
MSGVKYDDRINNLRQSLWGLKGLTLFTDIKKDPVVQSMERLLNLATTQKANIEELYSHYHEFSALAIKYDWPNYLIDLILSADNTFSRLVSIEPKSLELYKKHVARDLFLLQKLYLVKSEDFRLAAKSLLMNNFENPERMEYNEVVNPDTWLDWELCSPAAEVLSAGTASSWLARVNMRIVESFESKEWSGLVNELTNYYSQVGTGILASFVAFRWDSRSHVLVGVANPDPIKKEQLIGQSREQEIVLENTEHFLAGAPANNMILYGNRGTGKSSLVKSLLHCYVNRGLRLVELAKSDLTDFPLLSRSLGKQNQKFIIFIDDLSFDESDTDYKALKTLLEGSLETKPSNVLIYATSNRRHLVRETFSERKGDEVHVRDNMEEKLSLSDRFGITVTFPAPDQEGYLKIVEGLAEQHNLDIERAELRQRALRWVMMHNGRSGRTARQFIDHLMGSQLNLHGEEGAGI